MLVFLTVPWIRLENIFVLLVDECPDGAQRLEDHLVNDDPRHGGGRDTLVRPPRR